jgi:hypothetical protein
MQPPPDVLAEAELLGEPMPPWHTADVQICRSVGMWCADTRAAAG